MNVEVPIWLLLPMIPFVFFGIGIAAAVVSVLWDERKFSTLDRR